MGRVAGGAAGTGGPWGACWGLRGWGCPRGQPPGAVAVCPPAAGLRRGPSLGVRWLQAGVQGAGMRVGGGSKPRAQDALTAPGFNKSPLPFGDEKLDLSELGGFGVTGFSKPEGDNGLLICC